MASINSTVKEDDCSHGMLSLPSLLLPRPLPFYFPDPEITSYPCGIILRTSSAFSGRYAYFPFQGDFFSFDEVLDTLYANSLLSAPHYPYITILDSISTNILYQTYNSFQNIFHVYNLINCSHYPISFPYNYDVVNATIVIHDCIHFKLLVVCIEEHPIPLFAKAAAAAAAAAKSLVFYVYSSKNPSWLRVPNPPTPLTSDQLLKNRRKPVHVGEDIAYLDLTDRFLIRFDCLKGPINLIRKLISFWERDSIKLDEATQYDETRGSLHCVKFNPIKMRLEIYVWMLEGSKELWRLVVCGKVGPLMGKVVGLCSHDENLVLMRSFDKDEIFAVDIKRGLRSIVMGGWGPKCGQFCLLKGMNGVSMGSKLQYSSCGILHPHENVDGPEGEVFHISDSGTELNFFLLK